MLPLASDKEKLFAKIFYLNSNLDDSVILLPVFLSRTNLKLYNISVTPKMYEKVIKNLDSSRAPGPDYTLVVVVKNCEPERSHTLAGLFNTCLKESWKVSLVVPVFKNVGENLLLKTTALLVLFLLLAWFENYHKMTVRVHVYVPKFWCRCRMWANTIKIYIRGHTFLTSDSPNNFYVNRMKDW